MPDPTVVDQVGEKYAAVPPSTLSNEQAGVRAVTQAFGYSPEELGSLPAESNVSLSCGDFTATVHCKSGAVVLELGGGGGLDPLLTAPEVGPAGKVIGMLPDGSVDCLVSNCVINLVPDKRAVFREMFRVLKPGGRVAVRDIALKKPLPPEVSQNVPADIGGITGAVLISDYKQMLKEVGFQSVQVVDAREGTSSCCSGEESLHDRFAQLLARLDVNEFAASVQVHAVKA